VRGRTGAGWMTAGAERERVGSLRVRGGSGLEDCGFGVGVGKISQIPAVLERTKILTCAGL